MTKMLFSDAVVGPPKHPAPAQTKVADHVYRAGRLPGNTPDAIDAASLATELRMELIVAEREYIDRMLQEGRITDEARRRIERELDLEEAGIACKKEGGAEPPL
jgi:hypothetical protein